MPFLSLNNTWSNLASYYNDPASFKQTTKPEVPSLKYSAFDDGLIRGGFLNATLASVRDTERIGKFLITGKGIAFGIKQIGLQKANIPLEKDPNQSNDPTRKYNLGVNLITQVPINAFGGHLIRHGLLPIGGVGFLEGDSLSVKGYSYERAVLNNNKSDTNSTITNSDLKITPTNRLVSYLSKISYASVGTVTLDEYNGGASSVYGIGKTRITTTNVTTNRSSNTSSTYRGISEYIDNYRSLAKDGGLSLINVINENIASNKQSSISTIAALNEQKAYLSSLSPGEPDRYLYEYVLTNSVIDTLNSNAVDLLNKQIELEKNLKKQKEDNAISNYDFKTRLNEYSNKLNPIDSLYQSKNIQSQFGVSTGKVGPNNVKKSSKIDSINVIDITDSGTYYGNIKLNKRSSEVLTSVADKVDGIYGKDIIKFAIEFLNNDSQGLETDVLVFRAYIDDFQDGMNAKWNSYRYMGRGEDFYVYDGFTRDISISFTIYAHSKEEILPIYTKLNYLLSTFAPDYNTNNKMRGNIAYLTVGDYLVRQPGIFTDIKLSGMLDTHWEVNLDNNTYQVPKHIKVSLSFKPIHTVLPRKVTRSNPFKSNFVLGPPSSTIVEKQKETNNPKNPASDNIVTQQNTTTLINNDPAPEEELKIDKTGKKGKKGK
jgi:hypothetical protein